MSVIKLEIAVDKSNIGIVSDFLNRLAVDTGKANNLKVVEPEEVDEKPAPKAPAKRASRAKPKPAPVEEDEDEYDPLDDDGEGEDDDEITLDDVKEAMADKVDDHRPAILKKLAALGASKMSELKPAKYQVFFDYLKGLK